MTLKKPKLIIKFSDQQPTQEQVIEHAAKIIYLLAEWAVEDEKQANMTNIKGKL